MFIQPESLTTDQLIVNVQRLRDDPAIQNVVLSTWDQGKAIAAKNVIPYNPNGLYKRLFVGNPALSLDYRNILNAAFRWQHLEASSAAARQALPVADGWYITYETGLNVFDNEAFRSPWEWYLGDMVRRLQATKNVPIIWSPYLFGPYTAAAVAGWAKTMRNIKAFYAPSAQLEVHVQDGVGAKLQTQASALQWAKAMRAAGSGVVVKMNVEWFDGSNYTAVDGRPRESAYLAAGIPIGACWEARYYNTIMAAPPVVNPVQVAPSEWGARVDYDTKTWRPWNPDKLVVHYEGSTGLGDTTVAREMSRLRAHEAYHIDVKRWLGLAYNYAIGNTGTLYRVRGENRSGATSGDQEPDGIPENHEARAYLFLIGGAQQPSAAAKNTFHREWVRWGKPRVTVHSDSTSTSCPGVPLRTWIRSGGYRSVG